MSDPPAAARPRDRLGRPVAPQVSAGVPAVPDGSLSSAEALRAAQDFLDAGLPFHAHEVLEQRWRCCPDSEREFWQDLARLAAAITHAGRGNATGAYSVGRTSLAHLLGVIDSQPFDRESH